MNKIDTKSLFNINETIAKDLFNSVKYPFEVLPNIKDYITNKLTSLGEEYNIIDNKIAIHNTANVSPKAEIIGPVIICANAIIKPFACIRENTIIGKNAEVGSFCEVKNSIIFNSARIAHHNYVGDSIIGLKVHFGAGAITSNLKSDETNIVLKIDGETIETGLEKFGALIGDNVEIGCNAVMNPGTVIGKSTNIYPLSNVRGYIGPNMIYKDSKNIIEKLNKE